MNEYQPYIEQRSNQLRMFMDNNWMTTTMLIEAVVELCTQDGIDLEQRVKLEKIYAGWRKEVA